MPRIVFMGTTDFATACLAGLEAAGYLPKLIVTKPDSPAGRNRRLQSSPVKAWAQSRRLPLWQPVKVNSPESLGTIGAARPDLLVVVAYGQILKAPLLALAPQGTINVHASLLPDLRGAAPVEWALMLGYAETGVTTMYVDEGVDTGDIILQRATRIGPSENSGQLRQRLAALAAELLPETIRLIGQGKAPRRAQPLAGPRLAPPLNKSSERLDWREPADALANKIRALAPEPGSFCLFRGLRLKIYAAAVEPGSAPAGRVSVAGKRLFVATGKDLLELLSVQPAGKRISSAQDFINGYRLQPGEYFH